MPNKTGEKTGLPNNLERLTVTDGRGRTANTNVRDEYLDPLRSCYDGQTLTHGHFSAPYSKVGDMLKEASNRIQSAMTRSVATAPRPRLVFLPNDDRRSRLGANERKSSAGIEGGV